MRSVLYQSVHMDTRYCKRIELVCDWIQHTQCVLSLSLCLRLSLSLSLPIFPQLLMQWLSHTHSCRWPCVFVFKNSMSLACINRWRIIRLNVANVYERVKYFIGSFGHWYNGSHTTPYERILVCSKSNELTESAEQSALWFIHYYKCVQHHCSHRLTTNIQYS